MKTKNINLFNTNGICSPDKHYMLDPLARIPGVESLISNHQYFAIHAPYQAGKTTCLHALSQQLNSEGNYISLVIPFKHHIYSDITIDNMDQIIANHIYFTSREQLPEKHWPKNPEENKDIIFSNYIADWSKNNEKPIVLLLDDIDTLPGDVIFLMLRHFRTGHQYRPHHFPSSIVLVGIEDVKDYKFNFPGKNNPLWNPPPYNINAESILLKDFSKEEVFELLEKHTRETGQEFPIEVKEEIFRLSQGQPGLTNALARQIVEKILENDYSREITLEILSEAKHQLILSRNTHLDSLIDKLKEGRVKKIVQAIINGNVLPFDVFDDNILYVKDLGIITQTAPLKFANPIYAEIIPRVMASSIQDSFRGETQT